jgi:hypothetical protein
VRRLDDDRREIVPVLFGQAPNDLKVVVWRDQNLFVDAGGHSSRIGAPCGIVCRLARRDGKVRIVVVPVISTFAFQALAAPGIGARNAHGVKRRFRSRCTKGDFFCARDGINQHFRKPDAVFV